MCFDEASRTPRKQISSESIYASGKVHRLTEPEEFNPLNPE